MGKNKPILISALLGLLFVILLNVYLNNQRKELLRESTPVAVVVAARDIPEGTRLQDSLLEVVEIPKRYIQPDVAKSVEELRDRQVSVAVLAGTQILGSMLALNQNIGLSEKIDKGYFAVTVPVDSSSGVAGLLQPGDSVDIYVTVEVVDEVVEGASGANQYEANVGLSERTEMMSQRVLSSIKILAVNRRSYRNESGTVSVSTSQAGSRFLAGREANQGQGGDDIETVTLAVTGNQSPALTLAKEIGVISLALHSSWNEGETDGKKKVGADELLGIDKPIIPRSADIFYGGVRRNNRF